jgi:hypothetical protein
MDFWLMFGWMLKTLEGLLTAIKNISTKKNSSKIGLREE